MTVTERIFTCEWCHIANIVGAAVIRHSAWIVADKYWIPYGGIVVLDTLCGRLAIEDGTLLSCIGCLILCIVVVVVIAST